MFFLMFQRRTQLSPMIVSNMIQSRGEALINHDLPIGGNSNPLEVFITTLIFIRPYKNIINDSIFSFIFLCFRGKDKYHQ